MKKILGFNAHSVIYLYSSMDNKSRLRGVRTFLEKMGIEKTFSLGGCSLRGQVIIQQKTTKEQREKIAKYIAKARLDHKKLYETYPEASKKRKTEEESWQRNRIEFVQF